MQSKIKNKQLVDDAERSAKKQRVEEDAKLEAIIAEAEHTAKITCKFYCQCWYVGMYFALKLIKQTNSLTLNPNHGNCST